MVFSIENFVEKYDVFENIRGELFFLETDGKFEKKVVNMMEKEEKFLRMTFG